MTTFLFVDIILLKMKKDYNITNILSLDTYWDRLIHRPPAKWLAQLLSHTPIRPNHVTLFTLVPAVVSAWLFTRVDFITGLWGLVFFYLWAMLDHVDGEIARMKNLCTPFGQKLDDACDNISTLIILGGIFWGTVHFLEERWQPLAIKLFVTGMILNIISGVLVLNAKRKLRKEAVRTYKVTRDFIFYQKFVDFMTGRDPFYLLIFFAIWSYFWKGIWINAFVTIYLAGVYIISIFSFAEWINMRQENRLVS